MLTHDTMVTAGKSDSCTREELDLFRARIREQLEEADISVYRFPGLTSDTDTRADIPWPLAVVGSNTLMEEPGTGARVRARSYPWGCVNIEDQVGVVFRGVLDSRLVFNACISESQ